MIYRFGFNFRKAGEQGERQAAVDDRLSCRDCWLCEAVGLGVCVCRRRGVNTHIWAGCGGRGLKKDPRSGWTLTELEETWPRGFCQPRAVLTPTPGHRRRIWSSVPLS